MRHFGVERPPHDTDGISLIEGATRAAFDRIASLVHRVLDVPVAFVSLIDDERQVVAGQIGLPEGLATKGPIRAGDALWQLPLASADPLTIEDAREDPLVRESAAIQAIGMIAYVGVPLKDAAGQILGTLCAFDRRPRHWTDEDQSVLLDLAVLAADEIEYRHTLRQTAELESLLERVEEPVRGLTDQVHSLIALVSRDPDPRVQRFAGLAGAHVTAIKRLLRDVEAALALRDPAPSGSHAVTDLRVVVRRSVDTTSASTGTDIVRLALAERPILVRGDAHQLQRSITTLLLSALHYASGAEAIDVRVDADGQVAQLDIGDHGRGIPAAELARIVSRFGYSQREDRGQDDVGASLRLVDEEVTVESGDVYARSSSAGTLFRIQFPLAWIRADDVESR